MKSLRYRRARNNSDFLGQVFTPPAIANLLVDSIPFEEKTGLTQVLDLGAGEGALTDALLHRITPKKVMLVELDKKLSRKLKNHFDNSRFDISNQDVLAREMVCPKPVNLILSNPPYGFISVTSDIEELFQSSDFDMPIRSGWVRGDLAFFLKAWDISQFGTNLGFIVASPLMRDRGYLKFRERLVKGMRHLSVTQLSNRTFENADVTAFLISGCRATNRRRNILLRKSLADGSIIDEMEISSEQAILSLDIDFHRAIQRIGVDVSLTDENIASIGIAIERGSKSLNDFRRLGIRAFHTTDFPENKNTVSSSVNQVQFKYASQGDILIPRVGSRCLAKQVRVKEGDVVFTDCIYRLTGNKKSLGKAWKTLNSTFGAEWRLANANGSCARFLTLDSILSMPIIA